MLCVVVRIFVCILVVCCVFVKFEESSSVPHCNPALGM